MEKYVKSKKLFHVAKIYLGSIERYLRWSRIPMAGDGRKGITPMLPQGRYKPKWIVFEKSSASNLSNEILLNGLQMSLQLINF